MFVRAHVDFQLTNNMNDYVTLAETENEENEGNLAEFLLYILAPVHV